MNAAAQPLIVFTPSGRRGRFDEGTTVLDAGRALGVDIDSVCGGRGLCGRCQVQPSLGEFPRLGLTSSADHLASAGELETEYVRLHGLAAGRRLACTATVRGDLVIDVPAESQVHRQVVRKELARRAFQIDPVVRLHYVQVAQPQLASPRGDLARLKDALAAEWDLTGLETDLHVIRALPAALEAGSFAVTVAVHDGRVITAVWPGLHERALGVALDVGSTTIAGHLVDLSDGAVLASEGVMNPQIRFGEDLMSRVSYAMLHPDGAAAMTRAVRAAVGKLVASLAARAGVPARDILELAVVGNPIMHHLLLGLDPVPLGTAPFTLATDEALEVGAAEIGVRAHPGARVYVLPCIAGHVGADTAGVILAEEPQRGAGVQLAVDVGTNAEIVLGVDGRLLAASSPTGPAFEGAQISGGQRAAPGAIERVRIDPQTHEPRVRVIGCPLWSDEPGFPEALGDLAISGICGSGIVEVVAQLFLAGIVSADGVIDGALAARTPRVIADGRTFAYVLHDGSPRLVITQNDVRAIQLAKAALYAGARLLMDHAGVDAVDEVRLAGAFGSQIDGVQAMALGLIPDCDPARVVASGNAAGTGALMALLSVRARREIEATVRRVEKIETAVEPAFQAHFVDALAFPHRTAPSTHLGRVVALPQRPAGHGASGPRRRERGRPVVNAASTKEP